MPDVESQKGKRSQLLEIGVTRIDASSCDHWLFVVRVAVVVAVVVAAAVAAVGKMLGTAGVPGAELRQRFNCTVYR